MIVYKVFEMRFRTNSRYTVHYFESIRGCGTRVFRIRSFAMVEAQDTRIEDLEVAANGQDEHRSEGIRSGAGETYVDHAAQLQSVHYLVIGRSMNLDRTGVRQTPRRRVRRIVVLSHKETRDGVEEDGEGASEKIIISQTSRRFHTIAHVFPLGRVQRRPEFLADREQSLKPATEQENERESRLPTHEGEYHRERLHPGVEVYGVQREFVRV